MDRPLVPHREPNPPIGRAREIEYLTNLLDAVERGERRAAILVGAAGVGKTMLLRYARRLCIGRSFRTILVRAPAIPGLPPLFPIGEIVESLAEAYREVTADIPDLVVRMTDALAARKGRTKFRVAVPQMVEAIETIAKISPLAILFDDYHWGPREGMSILLTSLRVVDAPVLFLATARPGRDGADQVWLAEPTADLWFDHLHLELLDRESLRILVEQELGSIVLNSITDLVFSQSQGNPLYASELLRDWRSNSRIENVAGYWGFASGSDPPVPRSLHEVLGRRLDGMDPQAFEIVGGLALLGRDASFEELNAIGPNEFGETVTLVRRLIHSDIVREDGTPPRYQLAHPLYVPILLSRMGATGQAITHERIFRGLNHADARTRSSELAHHAYHSLHHPPDLADLIVNAAEEADRVGSYEESARWYERLAKTRIADPRALVEALEKQAGALANFAPREAVRVFTEAIERSSEGEDNARLLLGRARAFRHLGQFDHALADLDRALAIEGPKEQGFIKFSIARILGIQGHVKQAERILRELTQEALPPKLRADVLGNLGTAAFTDGDVVRAIEFFKQSLAACPEYSERIQAASNLVWTYMIVGQWGTAREILDSSIQEANRMRDDWHLIGLLTDSARLYAWQGNFSEAIDAYLSARRLEPRMENPLWEIECLETLGIIQLESGSFREAGETLGQAGLLIRDAIETREPAFTFAHLAEAKCRTGDLPSARLALDAAKKSLDRSLSWSVSIERVEGLCALTEGRREEALTMLALVVEHSTAVPFEQGKALTTTADALIALHRRDEAIISYEQASKIFDRLGAKRRSALAKNRIAELVSKRLGRPPKRTVGNFTPREADVLRLLIRGRTSSEIGDALFISKRTVDKHIERMLDRSNSRTRTELVSLALRQKLLPEED